MDNIMTFFSGTDTTTLKEEGMDRNHFVSLIVNNEGTYTAAITRKVKATKLVEEHFSYPTFEDNEVVDIKSYEVENEELQWFYLKIEFEKTEDLFYKEIDLRLTEIRKAKEEKARLAQQKSAYQERDLIPSTQVGKKITQSFVGQAGPANLIKREEELPFDYGYMDNTVEVIPYGHIKFNKNTIKSLVLQLITGSIIISNSSKIDINKWAQGMVPLYEDRFGKGEPGLKLFKAWADGYVEFLCWFSEDEDLMELGYEDDELAAICAHDIIEELTKLPKNKYIKIYINILQGYLR